MQKINVLKICLTAALIGLLAGCKLTVIAPPGGHIESSSSPAANCAGGTVCEIEITDPDFVDAFTAVAEPGYEFAGWQQGIGFLCEDAIANQCVVSIPEEADGVAVVSLFATAYIMPVWRHVGIDTDGDGIRNELDEDDDNDGLLDVDDHCPLNGVDADGFGCDVYLPITDTVMANDGREWAQVDLFNDLQYSEIAAVCPNGVCAGGLNGHDMTGWTWASAQAVLNLFNSYLDSGVSVPPVYKQLTGPSLITTLMVADGWASRTYPDVQFGDITSIGGFTADGDPTTFAFVFTSHFLNVSIASVAKHPCAVYSNFSCSPDNEGGWFYRQQN